MTQTEPDKACSDLLGECHAVVRDTWNEVRSDLLSECHAVVRDAWEKPGVIDPAGGGQALDDTNGARRSPISPVQRVSCSGA